MARWCELREQEMTRAYRNFIDQHSGERAVYLGGLKHCALGSTYKKFEVPSFRTRCEEELGVKPYSLSYCGGMQIYPENLTAHFETSGLHQRDFMINLRKLDFSKPELHQLGLTEYSSFDLMVRLADPPQHMADARRRLLNIQLRTMNL